MDSIAEKFSIFDYFNLLIGGMIFIFGVGLCNYSETKTILLSISETIGSSTFLLIIGITLFIVVSYVIGTVINEIGHWFFKENRKWEQNLVKKCLISLDVVGNKAKLESYKKKASKFLSSQVPDFNKEFENNGNGYTEDHCSYFFAYCVYYIQIHNQDKKPERLREVQGLSMLLTCVFALIPLVDMMISIIPGNVLNCVCVNFGIYVLCAVFTFIFVQKYKRDIKNRVRMVLAVYDAYMDAENRI